MVSCWLDYPPWKIARHKRHVLTQYSGKQWHGPRKAFRPKAGNTSWVKRSKAMKDMAATKAKEKDMKDEKEQARQVKSPVTLSTEHV